MELKFSKQIVRKFGDIQHNHNYYLLSPERMDKHLERISNKVFKRSKTPTLEDESIVEE